MMDSIPRIISLRLWDCRKRPKISRWNVRILDELGGRDYSLVLDRSSENYTRNVRNHRPIVVRGVPQIIQVVIPYYIWLYMIYYTILVLKPMVTWGTTTLVPPPISFQTSSCQGPSRSLYRCHPARGYDRFNCVVFQVLFSRYKVHVRHLQSLPSGFSEHEVPQNWMKHIMTYDHFPG